MKSKFSSKQSSKRPKQRSPFDSYTKYALSDQEIQRCLIKCDTTEKELLIRLGVFYGFRRDDMRVLEIKNVDFTNKQILFADEKKDALRNLPMSDDIMACLKKHINTHPKNAKYLFSARFKDKSLVGTKPIGSVTLYRLFQDILLDADIPNPVGRTGRPFHALRGTCVKTWKRKGMDAVHVALIIGDTMETMMKHYETPTVSELADTINKMG
jgi:integrase